MTAPRETGTTLLLCVLLLSSISLVALAAASASGLQLRMSHNVGSEQQALEAALSANAWAERWLLSLDGSQRPQPCTSACSGQQAVRAAGSYPPLPEYQGERWWLDHGYADGYDPHTARQLVSRAFNGRPAGRWIVEEVQYLPSVEAAEFAAEMSYYRVIARAVHPGLGTPVVVESIIARPWGNALWQDALPRPPEAALFCTGLLPGLHCGRRAWQRRL